MFFKRSSKGRQALPDTRNRSCKGIEAYAHMIHSRGRGERNWTEQRVKGACSSKTREAGETGRASKPIRRVQAAGTMIKAQS